MEQFTKHHQSQISGVLSGFDRLRLRGTMRWLANVSGMHVYLSHMHVLLKDFSAYAKSITDQMRTSAQSLTEAAGRPVQYLNSSAIRKEQVARNIAAKDHITEGLICLLTCVEPCHSYKVGPNRQQQKLELRHVPSKCLHQYFYLMDQRFGLMHLRVQTWFPFNIHVCMNGREWLARQMDASGIDYRRVDNCFTHVSDVQGSQQLFDQQLKTDWNSAMNHLVHRWLPVHTRLFSKPSIPYYWSADETEWASDIMFKNPAVRNRLYPRLVRHSMQSVHCGDVMRFLGHYTPAHGGVHGKYKGEVHSDMRRRQEGVRVKHWANNNSVKMYDKQNNVLRIETTINNTRDFKVYRRKEGDGPEADKKWLKMRKGVADLHRRAQISQLANERYMNALANVDDARTLGELTGKLCSGVSWKKRKHRALNPMAPADLRLLETIRRGEFMINGFRNRDIRKCLFKNKTGDKAEQRRRAGKITRQLRLLRAHGLIKKISRTHRYILQANAAVVIDALLSAQNANIEQLQQFAP